jgi:hypothetical protein
MISRAEGFKNYSTIYSDYWTRISQQQEAARQLEAERCRTKPWYEGLKQPQINILNSAITQLTNLGFSPRISHSSVVKCGVPPNTSFNRYCYNKGGEIVFSPASLQDLRTLCPMIILEKPSSDWIHLP